MMKRILFAILLLTGMVAEAQYNNEWIDYNKTYFKFPVGKTGLYRIPQASLQAIGLGSTPAEQFQLWRNGKEVPMFTSVPSGLMGGTDYIEFWGEMNDGKPDKKLYRDTAFQLSNKWSLETDTAAFFLTVNSLGGNLRVSDDVNNVAANVLPPEPYFIFTLGMYFKNRINPGFAAVIGEYVYSSSYDVGEGYSSLDIYPSSPLTINHTNLYPYTSGPDASLYVAGSGNALNSRTLRVKVNNTQFIDQQMDFFSDLKTQSVVPISQIASGSASVELRNTSANPNDRLVVAKYELSYPRLFNFGGSSNFVFDLPASGSGNYLEITNFNYGTTAPELYDLSNLKRYSGDLAVPGKIRFALPASAQVRHLILVNEEASNLNTINSFTSRNFVNYALPANQGNYLIISNQFLYSGPSGNQVEAYRAYRSSAAGGGFDAKIYDIDQLQDQFGLGIKRHPGAIKNFLVYARDNFATPPNAVFLIGKGVTYTESRTNESDPNLERMNLVPTFGYPASDNLLASNYGEIIPATPIGRLSVVSSTEILNYLNKVKEYESAGENAAETIAGRAWMKNVAHAAGGGTPELRNIILGYMSRYKNVIEDTLFGGKVYTFAKEASGSVQSVDSKALDNLFAEGLGLVTYFGHSSANVLEFNIEDPYKYNNPGKYPLFIVNGCLAGNIFNFDPVRFSQASSLSEKYILAVERGSIGFIASSHFGIVNYLDIFNTAIYNAISHAKYGSNIGEFMEEAVREMLNITGTDYYARLHGEELTLHGDPVIKMYGLGKPDYVVEESKVQIDPAFISIAESSFQMKVGIINLGKAVDDSFVLEIKRQYPDGSSDIVYRPKMKATLNSDSITLSVPIIGTRDKGLNKITVTVDADSHIDEISENNNSYTRDLFIYEDEIRPVYPYNYAIINDPVQKLYASTADPVSVSRTYVMELDTTARFNSPSKISKTVTSIGGVLEFDPGISYQDSIVYYWRTSTVPSGSGTYLWTSASFMYRNSGGEGYNQSHYYQHLESNMDRILIDSASLQWKYDYRTSSVLARNGIFPIAATQASDISVSVNGSNNVLSVCGVSGIIFSVYDPISLRPWLNAMPGNPPQYGSDPVCGINRIYNFQYNILDTAKRRKAAAFLNIIPPGYFVVVRNISDSILAHNTFAKDWQADSSFVGPDNSLYDRLLQQGFTGIDSFSFPRAFIFIYKKDMATDYTPKFLFSQGVFDRITLNTEWGSPDTIGFITSPKFGPAKAWKNITWQGNSLESPSNDQPTIDVVGYDVNNNASTLFTLDKTMQNFDISAIDPVQYPFLQLKMRNIDSVTATPYQLNYWRIHYTPVPEGGMAANLFFTSKDTLDIGEQLHFGIAFKNVSKMNFDSLTVKCYVLDRNNVSHTFSFPKQKALVSGDTITLRLDLDTRDYPENNTLYVEFNPDNNQPEEYHFNNFIFKKFYVKPDNFNPLLDVTFDGVHILNRDIVSAQPHIVAKLKDDSRFLALDDTSLMKLQLRYPDGTLRNFSFDNDTLRFTPSNLTPGGSDNTASIDFNPRLLQDGDYELILTGKDKSGNEAGQLEYRVSFKVINKPMISNLLNYPNPFTTSTAFVFTVTGVDVPQNLKIEIMTITGKIVREITMNELGPIHIGRNITEYKWDGTDQFGQKLANGVYLYRVVSNLNGKSLDKYRAEGDDTDKYFTKGYGKMYLMR